MIIVDSALRRRAEQGQPIRVGMVGAGFMGRGLVRHIVRSVPGMRVAAIANRNLANARRAYTEAGLEAVRADTAERIEAAISAGRPVVTEDAFALLAAEGIDCLVDVTGAVEFGARVTITAIERGLPVVTMNAELDGTIGPLLAHRARRAGTLLTAADGDQPGVQGNLLRFVRSLGVTPLVAGNVKGFQNEHRTPTTQQVFADRWGQNVNMVTSFTDGTKVSFEQAIVANAHGLTVARRGMYAREYTGHIDELTEVYDVDELHELGGVVDYVIGARPGPGVYVLGTHDDPRQRHYLELYKLGKGPVQLLHAVPPLSLRGPAHRRARGRLRRRRPDPTGRTKGGRGRHRQARPESRQHAGRPRRLRHVRRCRIPRGDPRAAAAPDGHGRRVHAAPECRHGHGAHL